MSLIDDIKRDREEGTQGPWGNDHPTVYTSGATFIGSAHYDDTGYAANTRRIARVPDMEAALLAADELAEVVAKFEGMAAHIYYALTAHHGVPPDGFNDMWHKMNVTHAAYRKATEVAQ